MMWPAAVRRRPARPRRRRHGPTSQRSARRAPARGRRRRRVPSRSGAGRPGPRLASCRSPSARPGAAGRPGARGAHDRQQVGGGGPVPRPGRERRPHRRGEPVGHAVQVEVAARRPGRRGLGRRPGGRDPAGGGVGHDRAPRPDVAGGADRVAGEALGRHPRRRAHPGARPRDRLGAVVPGDAEVDDAGPVGTEHDVAGVEVAVHDPGTVDRHQRLGQRGAQHPQGAGGQRAVPGDVGLERRAGHVGGGQPGRAATPGRAPGRAASRCGGRRRPRGRSGPSPARRRPAPGRRA